MLITFVDSISFNIMRLDVLRLISMIAYKGNLACNSDCTNDITIDEFCFVIFYYENINYQIIVGIPGS